MAEKPTNKTKKRGKGSSLKASHERFTAEVAAGKSGETKMKPGLWFWLLMLILLLWGGRLGWNGRAGAGPFFWGVGWSGVVFVILCFLGWRVFGAPWNILVQ